jgi:hypothetical protein
MPTYWLWTFPKYSFTWLEREVLSTFPRVWCWFPALAVDARYERELSLSPTECDGMGDVWMRWVKTWWTIIIKYWWTWIGNQQPYIGLLLYPCIPFTIKHTQSIGWELVASTNVLIIVQQDWMSSAMTTEIEGVGIDGLVPTLKFGWGDEVYARWLSTPTLVIAREGGAFTRRRATSTLMKICVRFC